VRVIIVDDSALIREGLMRVLDSEGIEVPATFPDAEGVAESVAKLRPDVVIVDIRMPPAYETEGLELALGIRREHPTIGILVLSQHIETRYAIELVEEGAAGVGYLLKDRVTDIDTLLDALERVTQGGSVMDPSVVERLIRRPRHQSALDRLTEREHEVLSLMAEGHTNAHIAERLFVNQRTAESHVSSNLIKLDLPPDSGVDRRVSAVVMWLKSHTE
jgi:DNA-binding NarL/FixJ family response regulator